MVERINRRYESGRPSNDVASAGVLLHIFDAVDVRPWNEASLKRKHDPDTLAATIVNKRRMQIAYGYGCAGFVVHPVSTTVKCAYERDAGSLRFACSPDSGYPMAKHTLHHPNGTCLGGCGAEWCSSWGTHSKGSATPCAWRRLSDAMRAQERTPPHEAAASCSRGPEACVYNEVVIDLAIWRSSLPRSIDAVFMTPRCDSNTTQRVIDWHAQLLLTYPGQLSVHTTPLLVFDPHSDRAFRDVTPLPPPSAPPSPPETPPLPALPHDCSWRLEAGFHDLRVHHPNRWCSDVSDQGRDACQRHYYFRRRRGVDNKQGGELVRCAWQSRAQRCASGRVDGVNVFSCPPPAPPPSFRAVKSTITS